jgi:Glucose / Sorbosone dehydrogenase
MKLHIILTIFIQFMLYELASAQRVQALTNDISVDSILLAKPWASKLALDPISKHLFYCGSNGNIYEVFEAAQTDSLRFTNQDHSLTRLQGMCFMDSTLFLSGNIWYSTTGIGLIMKGILQPDGTRIWSTVLSTEAYPTSGPSGDHGFTGLNIDPQQQFLYFSSGSRTSFGEVQTNNGAFPGLREQALTSKIFRIPVSAENIYLYNDSTFLDTCGYVFAMGTRNAYDMAWNAQDHLFAIDNAGERDDPEELNWIQEGHHYGFPWRIGGNLNPLTNPNYNAAQDPLINPQNSAYLEGHFNADPNFPQIPSGLQFTEPLSNYGAAADYYKNETTGKIEKSSESGTPVKTFTPHRSPLGLVIDKNKALGSVYSGKGFVMSFMPGGDSTGFSPISPWGSPCPFVDPSRELVMMNLYYDSLNNDYAIQTSNIVTGFYLPVDAEQVGNSIYIIENNGVLWKIRFPAPNVIPTCAEKGLFVYPNPSAAALNLYYPNPNQQERYFELLTLDGKLLYRSANFNTEFYKSETLNYPQGCYYIQLLTNGAILARQQLILN